MRVSTLPGILASVLAALALAGCSDLFSPDGPQISIAGSLQHTVAGSADMRVDVGGRRVRIELHVWGTPVTPTRRIQGPRYGDVPVRVAVTTDDGDTLATMEFIQRFARDNHHWVSAVVGLRRPEGHCIGTLEVAPLPAGALSVAPDVQDTLFLMHGNIPKGVIC